jgi:hypothetical protein
MLIDYGAQRALVLTPDNRSIDVARTGELFGQAGLSQADAAYARKFKPASVYQPIGTHTSVFRYRDSTYVVTFFDGGYHSESQRREGADVPLEDQLGVFLRKNAITRQVCEYDLLDSGDDQ